MNNPNLEKQQEKKDNITNQMSESQLDEDNYFWEDEKFKKPKGKKIKKMKLYYDC